MSIFKSYEKQLEQIAAQFERSWRAGERPTIRELLPRDPAFREDVLHELVGADLELRLEVGEAARVEDYVPEFPEIQNDSSRFVELIRLEYDLRVRREPGLQPVEYAQRFPDYADQLQPELSSSSGTPAGETLNRSVGTHTPESGRFRLLRHHAQGGLGSVWIAHDDELDREVAVKEMKPELGADQTWSDRFLQEAAVTGRLQHPGIVSVYGAGKHHDGRPYFAMRFVQGETLKEVIQRHHATDWSLKGQSMHNLERRRLLGDLVNVCNTVHYAHGQQVLHRDLKPSNIMIGNYGETVVLDWGLARVLDDDSDAVPDRSAASSETKTSKDWSTTIGQLIGSPPFMSPEQRRGEHDRLTPATDIYSLGATLYFMLTNHPPQPNDATQATQNTASHDDAKTDSRFPPPLHAICRKAMAENPADRYPSAKALANDIEQFLADEPTIAYQETALDRLTRVARRRRPLVVASTVALVAIAVMATVFSLIFLGQKRHAEQLAEEAKQLAADAEQLVVDRDRQHQRTRRVVEVLTHLWTVQTPNNLGREVTVAQAMDHLCDGIDRLNADPLVKASLMKFAAEVYQSRGELQRAIEWAQRAVDIHVAELGQDTPEMLASMTELALMYHGAGEFEKASRLYDHVVSNQDHELADYHRDIVRPMILRADNLLVMGKIREALAAAEGILDIVSVDGKDHELTVAAWITLGNANEQAGRYEEARRLYDLALAKAQTHLASDHQLKHRAIGGVAGCLYAQEKHELLIQLLEPALKATRGTLGESHHYTLRYMNDVALSHQHLGHPEVALESFQRILEIKRENYGPNHFTTFTSIRNLALAYQDLGNPGKCIELLEGLHEMEKVSYPDSPQTLRTMNALARAYGMTGKVDRGIAMMEEVVDARTAMLTRSHAHTILSVMRLGALYELADRLEDADAHLSEALQLYGEGDLSPRHETFRLLTRVKLRRGMPAEAAELSQRWLDFLSASRTASELDQPVALMLRGEALLGEQEELEKIRQQLEQAKALLQNKPAATHLTAHVESLLGRVSRAERDLDQAQACFERACHLFAEAGDSIPHELRYRALAATADLESPQETVASD